MTLCDNGVLTYHPSLHVSTARELFEERGGTEQALLRAVAAAAGPLADATVAELLGKGLAADESC